MITFPNAKINLGLSITEKRPDGYHNLETVFYPVALEDALEIRTSPEADKKFSLHQYGMEISGNPEDNLVVKAYLLLDKEFHLCPIEIHLYKHIPSGAGLGGGSSDAAFMLKLLNEHFQLNLSEDQLEIYAATLGADHGSRIRRPDPLGTRARHAVQDPLRGPRLVARGTPLQALERPLRRFRRADALCQ